MKNIALVGNSSETLIRFRFDLIKDLVKKGHTVYAFSPNYTLEEESLLIKEGVIPVTYNLSRTGINPFKEILAIHELKKHFDAYRIEVVLSYFIKPVIYGSIAAKWAGVKNINSMIAGLGYIFTRSPGQKFDFKRSFLKRLAYILLKIGLFFNNRVFFQNPDDLEFFVEKRILKRNKAYRVFGSGVNLNKFRKTKPINKPITFISTGRLLVEKGFREFAKAAESLKEAYPESRFILLGGYDENPSSIKLTEIKRWKNNDIIEWKGQVNNVNEWLENSSVFVLPSYREGTPRSTLEAMATGLPIITTDTPGCRETVDDGKNGFLVPVKDTEALKSAMELFIRNPTLINQMGEESRKIAEEFYDVKKVNRFMMDQMKL